MVETVNQLYQLHGSFPCMQPLLCHRVFWCLRRLILSISYEIWIWLLKRLIPVTRPFPGSFQKSPMIFLGSIGAGIVHIRACSPLDRTELCSPGGI